MKELFIIAEELTLNIIEKYKEITVEKIEITLNSFSLIFGINETKIIFNFSTHHLDMPWQIVTDIKKNNKKIGSLEKILDSNYDFVTNPRYEITPLFLSDLENRIDELVNSIVNDLGIALPQIKKL